MTADALFDMGGAVAAQHCLARIECRLNGLTAINPQGETAVLDKCAWAQLAPCGCMNGITLAVAGDMILRSAEAAMRSMAANAADAKEDERLGFRMVLIRMEDYRAGEYLELFKMTCPHDPQWGYVRKTRTEGGVTWTRIGSAEWTAKVADKSWHIERYSGGWHLRPHYEPGAKTVRVPWCGKGLDESLTYASEYISKSQAVQS